MSTQAPVVDKLNQAQWSFMMHIFQGMNNTEAYLAAYPGVKRSSAESCGAQLLGHPRVQEGLNGLRERKARQIILTSNRISELRAEVSEDLDETTADRLRAMSDEERMRGFTAPKAMPEHQPGAILILCAGPTVSQALPKPPDIPQDALEGCKVVEETGEDVAEPSAPPSDPE